MGSNLTGRVNFPKSQGKNSNLNFNLHKAQAKLKSLQLNLSLALASSESSALAKLLRYWVVFSVHDDVLPFLELWNEPSEELP